MQLIRIAFAGVTIASMVRISRYNIQKFYPGDDEDYHDTGSVMVSAFLTIIFSISLTCTIGSLLCDIPVIISQFISTKVMNDIAFRTLVCLLLLHIPFILVVYILWFCIIISYGTAQI